MPARCVLSVEAPNHYFPLLGQLLSLILLASAIRITVPRLDASTDSRHDPYNLALNLLKYIEFSSWVPPLHVHVLTKFSRITSIWVALVFVYTYPEIARWMLLITTRACHIFASLHYVDTSFLVLGTTQDPAGQDLFVVLGRFDLSCCNSFPCNHCR